MAMVTVPDAALVFGYNASASTASQDSIFLQSNRQSVIASNSKLPCLCLLKALPILRLTDCELSTGNNIVA